MKQIGQRYQVQEDPSYHGFWCITHVELDAAHFSLDASKLHISFNNPIHFRDFDDAIAFIKLLEISDKCNGGVKRIGKYNGCGCCHPDNNIGEDVKIIGNIHENQELLEKK